MAENEGGLNYKIVVTDNIDSAFDRLEKRANQLEKRAVAAQKSATRASKSGKDVVGDDGLTKAQRDQIKKRQQKESTDEQKRLKKLETQRVATVRSLEKQRRAEEAKTEKARLSAAQKYNKAVTQGADKQRKATLNALKADILARDKIRARDAKAAATSLTSNESQTRKEELAALKASILERSKEAKLTEQTRKYNDASYQATQRNAQAARELAIKQQQINQLTAKGNVTKRKAAEMVGLTSSQAKQLKLNLFDAEHAARQFLFTFRRLVGILAIFTAARKFAQAIGAAVTNMIRFNSELETSQNSIAAILASVGSIRNEQGELVGAVDGFNVALQTSRDIVDNLRRSAIGSIATFEELTRAFEVAVGPGLAAGLDINQVQEVSKALSEGAKLLGLPINQLGEEIRSLLQGTATARNTRLAVLFGGAKEANETIRLAKEQGNLYEVLTEKLAAVSKGTQEASESFAVFKSDLEDAFRVLITQGGQEYFEELKASLGELKSAIVDVSGGDIIIRPQALEAVQTLSGLLTTVVSGVREWVDASAGLAIIQDIVVGLTGALKAALPLVGSVFSGLLDGVRSVIAPISLLLKGIGEINKALASSPLGRVLLGAVKYITAGAVGFGLWSKSLTAIQGLLATKGIAGALASISVLTTNINTALRAQGLSLISINGLTTVWAVLMGEVAISTTIATAGIALLLAGIGLVVAKMTIFKKDSGKTAKEVSEIQKAMEGVTKGTIEAKEVTQEGAKSAKDWADAIENATNALIKAEGLTGLTGSAKDFASNLVDAKIEIEKQTRALRVAKKEQEEKLFLLQREKEELQQIALSRGELQVGREGDIFITVGTEEAARLNEIKTEQLSLNNRLLETNESIAEEEANSLKILDLQTKAIQERAASQVQLEASAVKVAAADLNYVKLNTQRVSDSARKVAVLQSELSLLEANATLSQKNRDIALDTIAARIKEADSLSDSVEKMQILNALKQEQVRLSEENEMATALEVKRQEEKTKELQRQNGLIKGDIVTVLNQAFEDVDAEPLGTQIAEAIAGAFEDVSGVVGDVFKDAIDPRTDADIKTAFGEFFLDLAGDFATALTDALIVQPLIQGALSSLQQGQSGAPEEAGEESLIQQLTGFIGSMFTGLFAFLTGKDAAKEAKDTAIAVKDEISSKTETTTIVTALAAQTTALITAIQAAATQVAISNAASFATGGYVKGYASGGTIGGIPRPSHIPSSDTVPAWLTPGEYVLKKSAVRNLGTGFLDMLNGVTTPSSFPATAFALGGQVRGIQSFAEGGGVQSQAPSSSTRVVREVLPVLTTSEKNANQIFTGGRRALTDNVNKIPITGDINAKGGW